MSDSLLQLAPKVEYPYEHPRPPQPPDLHPDLVSLDRLPSHVFRDIFDYLLHSDNHTRLKLMRCNKQLYDKIGAEIYEEISMNEKNAAGLLWGLWHRGSVGEAAEAADVRKRGLLGLVRRLKIEDHRSCQLVYYATVASRLETFEGDWFFRGLVNLQIVLPPDQNLDGYGAAHDVHWEVMRATRPQHLCLSLASPNARRTLYRGVSPTLMNVGVLVHRLETASRLMGHYKLSSVSLHFIQDMPGQYPGGFRTDITRIYLGEWSDREQWALSSLSTLHTS